MQTVETPTRFNRHVGKRSEIYPVTQVSRWYTDGKRCVMAHNERVVCPIDAICPVGHNAGDPLNFPLWRISYERSRIDLNGHHVAGALYDPNDRQ